ncbi:MAG: ABC transporter ATP-binding protein [Mycobacteriaceae bacterium]
MTSSLMMESAANDGSGRIVVTRLTKRFGSVNAVNDLTFAVEPGTVTGFLGPNGSGKTTTLRMVLGLIAPTAGTATVNGVAFAQLDHPGRCVGAVLDSQGFHPGRKARQHLLIYTAALGVPDQRADEMLGLVGLTGAAGRKVGSYSLGMRQRLALAVALLGDPQVLVLDEPANGLDPEGIAWLRNFLKDFAGSGRTVLVSSHLLREVEQTVDALVIISGGACVFQGSLEDLRGGQPPRMIVASADASTLARALVQAQITDVVWLPGGQLAVGGAGAQQIGQVALDAGIAVYGMQEEQADLEGAFFALTAGQYTAAPTQQYPAQHPGPPRYGPPPGYAPR